MKQIGLRCGRRQLYTPVLGMFVFVAVVHASASSPGDWTANVERLMGPATTTGNEVLTYVVPRADLSVTVDGMAVPTAAGIESRLTFFACSCGKTRSVGQICCTDDEVNDVIDALRSGAVMEVVGVTPMFTRDRPRVMLVRFQGEGEPGRLAEAIGSALSAVRHGNSTTRPSR